MAPTPLKRLVALQTSRLAEIKSTSTRLREKERDTLNVNIIKSRVQRLNEIWSDARATHTEIIARGIPDTEPYVADDVFEVMLKVYEETVDFLLTAQTEIEDARPPVRPSEPARERDAYDDESSAAKLPKVDLPKFSGRYEDWESFRDLFTSLVHEVPRISDATKFQYLKTCLVGPAADLVKEVSTSNANYASTWQELKARFHSPRIIVNNHLRDLMDLPPIKRNSAEEMRSFTDAARRIVRALKNLKMPVEHWDVWFVFFLASRLDPESRRLWEDEQSAKDRSVALNSGTPFVDADPLNRFPKFSDLSEFLLRRTQALDVIAADRSKSDKRLAPAPGSAPGPSRRIHHAASNSASEEDPRKCPICGGHHPLHKCYKFKAKTPQDRRREVQRLRLCFNCFRKHSVKECTSTYTCSTCGNKHHSMLHFNSAPRANRSAPTNITPKEEQTELNVHTAGISSGTAHSVILATAQLIVEGPHGARTRIRALLDQGSETSFVSDSVATLLHLRKQRVNIPLTGIGSSTAGTARWSTRFTIMSLADPAFQLETNALILTKLTSQLPSRQTLNIPLESFEGLSLADPQFNVTDAVDAILGADVYGQLLRSGLRHFPSLALTAQNTALGWIVSGPVKPDHSRRAVPQSRVPRQILHCVPDHGLEEALQRFWVLEELPPIAGALSPHEDECENLFVATHSRDSTGRFTVRLPFKSELPSVGHETYRMALSSLSHMHRRFARDSKLAAAYQDFMSAYEELGHMERVPEADADISRAWYLPHHAVVQSTALIGNSE